jgi:hypothetical protein
MCVTRLWRVPESSPVPELPEPSAELILILALVQAHVRTLHKRERERFLADVAHSLGAQEAAMNVLRFRARREDAKVALAMKQARAWYRQAVAVALRLSE